jgi:L-fucose isomerase-like protein
MKQPSLVSFGYIPVGSLLMEHQQEDPTAEYAPALEKIGGQRWDHESISEPLPLFYFVATGGSEQKILQLREEREQTSPGEPVLLLAHPGNNSLPAALEVLARLQQDGARGRILYLRGPDDDQGFQQVAASVRDVEVLLRMRRLRIGLVGEPSDWLVASTPDPETVRRIWGPEIVPLGLDTLGDLIASIPDEVLEAPIDALIDGAASVHEPTREDLAEAVRIHLALKDLVAEHHLDAVSVRCFDLVSRRRTTGCLALARLNDAGVAAGCEGDLVSTLSMLWIRTLLEQTAWMANMAGIEARRNVLKLAHCTVPLQLTTDFSLRSHFESGLGVSIRGMLAGGPVTLVRVGGRHLDRIWLAEGSIIGTEPDDRLCRTQADVRLTEDEPVSALLDRPLGNHVVLTAGHHADRLRRWWEMIIKKEDA